MPFDEIGSIFQPSEGGPYSNSELFIDAKNYINKELDMTKLENNAIDPSMDSVSYFILTHRNRSGIYEAYANHNKSNISSNKMQPLNQVNKNLNIETLNHISPQQSIDRKEDSLKSLHGEPIPKPILYASNMDLKSNQSLAHADRSDINNLDENSIAVKNGPVEETKSEHQTPDINSIKPSRKYPKQT